MVDMKHWALRYADMGFAVFPVKPGTKGAYIKEGDKLVSSGQLLKSWISEATTDKSIITDWWTRWPNADICIATGSVSGGLIVVDLDVDEDKGINGYDVFKQWQKDNGELPDTCQAITGRGGYHLFYRDSTQHRPRIGMYDGIDIRAESSYVVAPPSLHPNGRRYEWEYPPDEYPITQANETVRKFLAGPVPEKQKKQFFESPETIPEGERTSSLIRLIGSLKTKGLNERSIQAAVEQENASKCVPPLTDQELAKTVFPAIRRGWQADRPYTAVLDNGKTRPAKNLSLEMVTMDGVEEKDPDWLILDYMPRFQITSLAGDGGSGKTTVWCALAAAVSSGETPFILDGLGIPFTDEPQKVMFFSAEDSYEYTLKRRLRKNGAKMENIMSIDIADERFQAIKFNSPFLEQLLEKYRPALCVFDPIQNFVPPDIRMGDRNAMRNCLAPLIGYGEKYGVTFLIIEHANKQSGVWGRKRIADSADIWDISRSVIMAGETNEKGVRYLSHEKSNYGATAKTVLYSIDDETVKFKGYTEKTDRDFVAETDYTSRQKPQREEAQEFILEFLQDGEKEISELDEMAAAMSISKNALKNAKTELKKERRIHTWSVGYGKEKKYFIRLLDAFPIATSEPNE